ncbi:MAG: hypothetical protein ACLS48_09475 [[Eubacterium] siraeum]
MVTIYTGTKATNTSFTVKSSRQVLQATDSESERTRLTEILSSTARGAVR